jgi:hypothetical protein
MMNRVWVVSRGENHEGGEVIGVCATHDGALALAAAQKPDSGLWANQELEADGTLCWSSGCDWLEIRLFTVGP